MQHLEYHPQVKRKLIRSGLHRDVGWLIRGDDQHQIAGREDQFLPMCLCAGLLHIPDSSGGGDHGSLEDLRSQHLHSEAGHRDSVPNLGGSE